MDENTEARGQGFLWERKNLAANSWPKVEYGRRYSFAATHSMDHLGGECAVPHEHHYMVEVIGLHEIQPHRYGYTHALADLDKEFEPLVRGLQDKHLNDVLPMPPSIEALALYFLANTQAAYCSAVELTGYSGYRVRADRNLQRSEWMAKFRK
jgi:6-pyruvoyl-tetrahydropterin synthase